MPSTPDLVVRDPRERVTPYAVPRARRSVLDLATSVVPYLLLMAAMIALAPVSPVAVLVLSVPTAGFLLRTFIVFHDCTHGSFLPSRRGNTWLGRALGLVVFTPFGAWRHNHAVHHATAGDLDRRGHGDVPTMTVAEYRDASRKRRLAYRLSRNPAIMFTIGPFIAMVIAPRLTSRTARPRIRNSVLLNDLALALAVAAFCVLLGWQTLLLVQVPMVVMAGGAGIWLFFVQHQFEDVYWESSAEWSYADAALRGSSYLKLPKLLQFFTGNIGLHHVHHLNARIPNYNLQAAHDEVDVLASVPVLTLRSALHATRLKLWDADAGRLVGFDAAGPPLARTAPTSAPASAS